MNLALMMTAALAFGSVMHDADKYIPNLLKIRTKKGEIIPFLPNRAQVELERQKRAAIAAGKPRRFLVLKNRQVGFSTHEVARNFHLVSTRFNMRAVTLAHTKDVAELLFRTANLFYDKLDPNLRPRRLSPRNKHNLDYPNLGSFYGIGTAKDASFGRSNTINRVHWSEVAYTPNSQSEQERLLTSLRHAAKHGEIVLESTANGFGNLFEFMVSEALAGRDEEWTLIFVPWWFDDDCRMPVSVEQASEIMASLSTVEKLLVEKHGLTADQIAFRRFENSTPSKRETFPQEFPEDPRTCFLTSGISYFDMTVVDELIRTTIIVPSRAIPGGTETIWEAPKPGLEYVAGVDTSEGIKGCDPNGIGIMERKTGRQVCSVHGLFDPDDLGDLAIKYALMYNKALTGVERNNHGHAVLRRIRSKGHGASQFEGGWLYYHSPSGTAAAAKMGWPTDQVTRPVMISDLRSAVNDRAIQIRDLDMLYECRTFRKQTNGKWEADSGKHDDSIFKWAIALQMRGHQITKPGFFVVKATV